MQWSKLFIPTLRENPVDAEVVSHQLLLRAGYIRQLAAGVYNYLYLAQRSILKITNIVREEMDAIGAQEFFLPALNPAEVWQESGRWDVMGQNMFRLKDRFGRDLCLGMTHEEIMTYIARGELRSYKQLPQIWYQIQTKFRDEPRPKSGLLRVRQFTMKDSYSFDIDAAGLDTAYDKHHDAYCKIFTRCGLKFIAVEADSGAMGGSQSHEFMVESNAGEDFVAVCDEAKYYANLEKATSTPKPPAVADPEGDLEPEKFHTPGKKTIVEISEFTGLPATSQIKSLVMMADNKPVLALVRGDHTMHETKFAAAIGGANEIRPAHPEEIRDLFGGTSAGSLGPIGVTNMRVIADKALEGRKNMICGANIDDYHLKNVTPGEDFKAEYFDLRQVEEGDTYEGFPIRVVKTVEIGHIFKLGYKYSKSMNLTVLDQHGKEVTPIMGSYGIGVERILTCAIELFNDKDGMSLPAAIAPFEVVVTPANFADPTQHETAIALYEGAKKAGFDALLDDRDERPGVKFKDADLIGIPVRITIGKKLAQGVVEVVNRRTRESVDVPVAEAIDKARAILRP